MAGRALGAQERKQMNCGEGRLVPPVLNLATSDGRLAGWAEYDATPASIANRSRCGPGPGPDPRREWSSDT